MSLFDDVHGVRLAAESELAGRKKFDADFKVIADSLTKSFASIADSLKRLADEWAPKMTGIVAEPGDVTTH